MRGILSVVYSDLGRSVADVVITQDAAGAISKPYGSLRYGAWALAVAMPPFEQVCAVIADTETIGKASAIDPVIAPLVAELQVLPTDRPLALAPAVPLLHRTRLPREWFSNAVAWCLVMARRCRFPLDISEGELRAAVAWSRVMAGGRASRRLEVWLLYTSDEADE